MPWAIRVLDGVLRREARRPQVIIHNHGSHFAGQFSRQLRVLGIEQRRTPVAMPFVNGVAERAVKSVRAELLNHVTARNGEELQWLVDEYREFYNTCRPHQALHGMTPDAFAEDRPLAPVIDLASLRPESVRRVSFALGILNGYVLIDTEPIAT